MRISVPDCASSCESNLTAIWSKLLTGAPLESIAPPPEAVAWSHELVHRGVPLPALLRAYRLGHGLAERRFEEAAGELQIEPDVRWRVLAHTSHHMFAYIDAICTRTWSTITSRSGRTGFAVLPRLVPSWSPRSSNVSPSTPVRPARSCATTSRDATSR